MNSTMGNSITNRIMGIVTLKAPTYKEVAEDPKATGEATTIVIATVVIVGILNWLISSAQGVSGGKLLTNVLGGVLGTIIGWVVVSWVLAWVATTFFQGKTNFGEMLRVMGYISIFDIIGVIPIIGWLIAGILRLIAYIIGIREAAEVTTTQAIGIAIIAVVVWLAVFFVLLLCALPFIFVGAVLGN